jgi:hypothetical protein
MYVCMGAIGVVLINSEPRLYQPAVAKPTGRCACMCMYVCMYVCMGAIGVVLLSNSEPRLY